MKAGGDLENFRMLLDEFRRWPGLASRNSNRVAFGLLLKPEAEVARFCSILQNARRLTKTCQVCFSMTEWDICSICKDSKRDQSQVCVVATHAELFAIQQAATDYKGSFHVLGGLVSPLEGVGAEDLSIDLLLKRVDTGDIREIVFALSPTPEGEVTITYIQMLLGERERLSIFKIASGIPVGTNLEFADRSTLLQAFAEKREVYSD